MRYLIENDVRFLTSSKKKLILILCFIPIIPLLLRINEACSFDTILSTMGANLNKENLDIISIIIFLFNISCYMYLIIIIYTKDLNEYLENIFLRLKAHEYIQKKLLISTIIISILKLIQYILQIFILILFNNHLIDSNLFILICTDIIYTVLLQNIILLIYIIYLTCCKKLFIPVMGFLMVIVIYPKNIWDFRLNIGFAIIILLIVLKIIDILFTKKSKKIIENV